MCRSPPTWKRTEAPGLHLARRSDVHDVVTIAEIQAHVAANTSGDIHKRSIDVGDGVAVGELDRVIPGAARDGQVLPQRGVLHSDGVIAATRADGGVSVEFERPAKIPENDLLERRLGT